MSEPTRPESDLSQGKRGAEVQPPPGKTRITIRIDDDVLAWFRAQVERAGGGSYQTLINRALRAYVAGQVDTLESTLRRVLRAEAPGLAVEAAAAEDDTLTGEPDDVSRTIDIVEAEGQLGELLTMALQGVDVILARDEAPLVRLVPVAPAAGRSRVAGLHPDAMQTSADFDAPFPDAFWLGET